MGQKDFVPKRKSVPNFEPIHLQKEIFQSPDWMKYLPTLVNVHQHYLLERTLLEMKFGSSHTNAIVYSLKYQEYVFMEHGWIERENSNFSVFDHL